MVKKVLEDHSDSPFPSPTPLPTSPLLNKIPPNALAERILNDPEAWKLLEDDENFNTDLRLSLGSSGIEEEMAWLENELKALNPSSSSVFAEKLASRISNPTDPFDTEPLHLESRRTYDHPEANTKSTQQGRASPKPRQVDLPSPYMHALPGGLDGPRHSNIEEPYVLRDQVADQWHARLCHFPSQTDTTRPLRRENVQGPEPVHVLSSSESSSNLSLSFAYDSHLPDNRTTKVHPTVSGPGQPSPTSCSTTFFSPLMAHSASTTLNSLEWSAVHPGSHLTKAARAENYRSLATATIVQQSKMDPSQSLPRGGGVINAAPRLPGTDIITSHEIGGLSQLSNTRVAAGINSSAVSKYIEKNSASKAKPKKRIAICARGSPKPMPTLPLPAVPSVTTTIAPPKDNPLTDAKTNTSREKTSDSPIRRLPVVPARSATLNFESGQPSLLVDTSFPVPPHTSIHTVRRSNTNIHAPKARLTPRFTRTPSGVNSTSTMTSNPSTSTITGSTRSPPCPAGPRNRYRRNDATPTKSARKGDDSPPATNSRSVLAPRVLPLHGYSKNDNGF